MKSVAAIILAAAAALAQAATLAINNFPAAGVVAGTTYPITYTPADANAPVTFTLKNGAANDLQTVAVLTTSATGGSWSWTVDANLPNGDYAMEIRQGEEVNYIGLFPLTGGSTSSSVASSSSASASASASVSASVTSSAPTSSVTVVANTASRNGTASVSAQGTGNVGTVTRSSTPTSTATSTSAPTVPFEGAAAGLSASYTGLVGVAAVFGVLAVFA